MHRRMVYSPFTSIADLIFVYAVLWWAHIVPYPLLQNAAWGFSCVYTVIKTYYLFYPRKKKK